MKQKIITYILSFISENDGTGSSSRLLAGTGVLATIIWVSYIVFKTRGLPDLGGAALFISASFSGYAVNQAGAAFSKRAEKKDDKSN